MAFAGLLVNTLTLTDQAMVDRLHNQVLVYPLDIRGREQYIPAKMSGIDEEFLNVSYPMWRIVPTSFEFDMQRFNEEVNVTTINSTVKRRTEPDQPYKLTYSVLGYAQDGRVFREMQEFLAYAFPPHQFLNVNNKKFYVNRVSSSSNLDLDSKEYVINEIFEVWVLLEMPVFSNVDTVWNDIVIGYTNAQGRYVQGSASSESQVIEP